MATNPSDPNNPQNNPDISRGSGRLGKASDAEPGEINEQEAVRGEGGSPAVHSEIIPNASLSATRVEAPAAEAAHAEAPHEAGLTQDVYTVGETFDPISHAPCELHGIMVEFEDSEKLVEAVRAARGAGYRKMDCYSPIPVEGLTEEMGWRDKKVPALMLCGGFTGFTLAWLLQYAGMAWFYPVNIGGKPLNSWPQYIVPAFEMTIFFTALTGVVSMLVLNGLPSPYHPVFNAPGFEGASSDRFFLVLEEGGPMWNRRDTLQFARTLGGVRVSEVQR